jgi:hypothetical protein
MNYAQIPGYEGLYEISGDGVVRSVVSGRVRAQKWHKKVGHWRVDLWAESKGRTFLVSRLVLLAFKGPPTVSSWTASHLNGDAKDNRLENLVWESQKDNNARRAGHGTLIYGVRAPWSKLDEAQVQAIRDDARKHAVIAAEFGLNQSNVSRIKSGERWKQLRRKVG